MVGAKGNAVIRKAQAQADGGVPAVRAGDFCVIDIVQRGSNLETPVGGDQIPFGGDSDTICGTYSSGKLSRLLAKKYPNGVSMNQTGR